jgi:hypothetical protein
MSEFPSPELELLELNVEISDTIFPFAPQPGRVAGLPAEAVRFFVDQARMRSTWREKRWVTGEPYGTSIIRVYPPFEDIVND